MEWTVTSPHQMVNPGVGFAQAVVAGAGSLVFLAGQGPHDSDGAVVGEHIVDQFERAILNVAKALEAADAVPEHLVSVQIFVTDTEEYKAALTEIGEAYRRHLGRHYPAMALFEVSRFFDPKARVELVCTAVVP